jgi:hypothetical protein
VARVLNSQGNLSRAERRTADAKRQYEEALQIYSAFAAKSPGKYSQEMTITEQNLKSITP